MAKNITEEEIFNEFKEMGIKDETAQKLTDLILYLQDRKQLSEEDLVRWKECNVLDKDGRLEADDEELRNVVFWVMIGLAWEGLVKVSYKHEEENDKKHE